MRTSPPGLETEGRWRQRGRRPKRGVEPDAYGWRQPGIFHGHYYGGWMPLYCFDKTVPVGTREPRICKAETELDGVPDLSDFIATLGAPSCD